MKKHVKTLISFIFLTAGVTIIAITLMTSQFFKFYETYINEEQHEIAYYLKLMNWAVIPLLKDGNFDDLKTFCDDLQSNRDIALFIYDEDNKLIAASRPDIKFVETDPSLYKKSILESYKKILQNKMITGTRTLYANGRNYKLRLTLSEDNMAKTFLKNQRSIIIVLFLSILAIFALTFYAVMYIKIPFDKLQESALKIANGEFDTNIYKIPKGMLSEHSAAIDKMALQLKQRIRDLQYFNNYRTKVITGLSHEVKTPLTGIMLSSELLESKIPDSDEETVKCLNILRTNCERLNVLILDLINLASLEHKRSNKIKNFETFNMEEVIEDAINIVTPLASDIEINFKPEEPVIIFADSQLIENAVLNILTNAVKYSKSKTIDVSLKQEDGNAVIKIRDYGIGIPPEHIDNIFDEFYLVDKARSRELGGTGLGLAIVRNIVLLHNGNITVKSENGCEFKMELPLNKKDDSIEQNLIISV